MGVGGFKGELTTLIMMTRVWFPYEDDVTKDFKRVRPACARARASPPRPTLEPHPSLLLVAARRSSG